MAVNTDWPFVTGSVAGTDLVVVVDGNNQINPDPGAGMVLYPIGQEP